MNILLGLSIFITGLIAVLSLYMSMPTNYFTKQSTKYKRPPAPPGYKVVHFVVGLSLAITTMYSYNNFIN